MPTTLPKRKSGEPRRHTPASERELLGATVFVAIALCVATALLPAQLVLPALSIIVIMSGVVLGAWALTMIRLNKLPNDRMLDIAGVLVLFGFAVAIICDKAELLRLLSGLPSL
jgi:hypothetical protein